MSEQEKGIRELEKESEREKIKEQKKESQSAWEEEHRREQGERKTEWEGERNSTEMSKLFFPHFTLFLHPHSCNVSSHLYILHKPSTCYPFVLQPLLFLCSVSRHKELISAVDISSFEWFIHFNKIPGLFVVLRTKCGSWKRKHCVLVHCGRINQACNSADTPVLFMSVLWKANRYG